MKVVIVEDEVRIREGLAKLLRKYYPDISEIYEAKSGEEGLLLIRRREPELVITDIRMEPMDGLEMLGILLKEEKRAFKTIIISAYTEFDYARQAIALGVSEYLVKPIDVGEFRKVMQNVQAALLEERQRKRDNPAKLGSMETILTGMINGQLLLDDEIRGYIKNTFQISPESRYAVVCIYMGRHYEEKAQLVASMVQSALVNAQLSQRWLLFLPRESELLLIFDGAADLRRLERYLQLNVMEKIKKTTVNSAACGFIMCESLDKIRESHVNIREYLPWNIALGGDVMISHPKITQVQAAPLAYPVQTEKDSIKALCAADYDRLSAQAEKLFKYFSERVYSPDAIKKSIIRYLLAILLVVKEINFSIYEKLDEARILEAVSVAVTRGELETVVFGLLETVMQQREKAPGLLVRKAQRIVAEFYRQGITLEEVAASLNMTPEYISARFVKELGVNFSTYIKNYRLRKAKELLLGTDLKIYEIAAQTGYSDAKYFSRVFKRAEGVLPAEYRQGHK